MDFIKSKLFGDGMGNLETMYLGQERAKKLRGFKFVHTLDNNRMEPYVETGRFEGYFDYDILAKKYKEAISYTINNPKQLCFTSNDSWNKHAGLSIIVKNTIPQAYFSGDVNSSYCEVPGYEHLLLTYGKPGQYYRIPPPAPSADDEAWFTLANVDRKNIKIELKREVLFNTIHDLFEEDNIGYKELIYKLKAVIASVRLHCRNLEISFTVDMERSREKVHHRPAYMRVKLD